MSDFSDQFAGARGRLFERFGGAATYRPNEGSLDAAEVSVTLAMIGSERREEQLDEMGRIRLRFLRTIKLETDSTGDQYSGVAEPKKNATILIAGTEYAITQIHDDGSGTATLELERKPMSAQARQGYYTK